MLAAFATVVVALVVALALPVACCCPDPDRCRCPDHDPSEDGEPEMRACHSTQQAIVSAQVPAFTAPALETIVPVPRAVHIATHVIEQPHPPPAARRPDAPS